MTLYSTFRNRFPQAAAVAGVGELIHKSGACVDRILDCYAVVVITAGGGFYRDAIGERSVRAGDVVVLFPNMEQDYGPIAEGLWSERFVLFYGAVFEAFEAEGILRRDQPVWRLGLQPPILQAFSDIQSEFQAPVVDQAWCVARMHLLLVDMWRRAQQAQQSFRESAMAAVADDIAGELRLATIAAQFQLSEQVFRKRFAAEVGLPPARWRQQRRIQRACDDLIATTDTLAAIAERWGWCDQFFFARQFKQATGQAPGAFRAAFHGQR